MQDTYKEVVIVLISGSVVFLVLAGIVIFILLFYQKKRFQHRGQLIRIQSDFQQELLKTQLETQEATFRQIAEELHDNVGQLLSTTKVLVGITIRMLPEAPDTLHTAEETLGKAIQDLRSLSKSLNSEWLEKFDLIENLSAEIQRINAARTLHVSLYCSGKTIPLPASGQVMLFRIIQEALQNSIKHAEAEIIRIYLKAGPELIDVNIIDDGKGLPVRSSGKSGLGMLNMGHRVRLLGGSITWQSITEEGTQVHIILPVQKDLK